MADNINIAQATTGTLRSVATDEIGGVNYQIIKLAHGVLDSATLVSTSNPLPIGDAGGTITVDGTVAATQSGTWNIGTITTLPALPTGSNAIGSITNTTFAATQSGTWNINNIAGTISLPTGAATSAKQPALGTAGTASSDVITVQGIASGTPLSVSMTTLPALATGANVIGAVTQSGTWNIGSITTLPALPTGANTIGAVNQNGTWNITNVSGTISLPTGAATSAKQPALGTAGSASSDVITVQGIASGTSMAVSLASLPALATGSNAIGSITNTGFNATQSGTWNITNVSGTISLPTGAATAAKQPAIGTAGVSSTDVISVQGIASGTAMPVSIATLPALATGANVIGAVTQSGTWNIGSITTLPALPTGANAIGSITNTGFNATQSGTWNITNVSGTISLPTGAATSAKQPALGTAGSASTDVITVQGIASGTVIPASLASLPALATGANTIGAVNQNGTWTVQPGNTANTTPWLAKISDGTNVATLLNLTNSKPVPTAIVDGSGNQITSFGGGTQYADGAAAATPTGTQVTWNESGTQRAASLTKGLPIQPGTSTTFAATQSGTWNVTNISGTVSLPTGAATAAKQPAIGTAGVSSTDVISVQGIASGTAMPVSLASLPALATGANVIGAVTQSGTWNIGSITTLPALPTGANAIGSITNTSFAATQSGTWNVTNISGTVSLPTGAATAAKQPALGTAGSASSDVISVQGIASGTAMAVSLASLPALATGTNTIGSVGSVPVSTGNLTTTKLISANTTNATSVKGSAGQIYKILAFNTNAAARFLKLYNKASAPTVGSDTPVATLLIPGNTSGAGLNISFEYGMNFGTGIAFATTISVADAASDAVAANELVINILYI